ncbi:MAG: CCA tRNA nucleotidyltransferase [Bacteroidota bacterium]|nr:CCA tRNA nucleotidyltransferase [Sphingobacteriales bacterium]
MKEALQDPIFKQIATIAKASNVSAYVVGGYVRDTLLKRKTKDVDVVVLGDGIALAKQFAQTCGKDATYAYFKNFGTAMVKTKEWEVEFVGARKESYSRDSRKPEVTPGTLEDDQNRRDFTINALAISLNDDFGTLVDPFNGINDLNQGIIQTPTNPDITFSDDPLRMLRGIRFAAQLGFTIAPKTFEAISRNRERIKIISTERISEELNKMILAPVPSVGFKLLFECGLLKLIFPELQAMQGIETKEGKAHKDNFYHTLQVLDNLSTESNDLWLRWAAILHDIAKPVTKRFDAGNGWTFHGHEDKGGRMVSGIFRRLKLPLNEKMKFVEKIVSMHHRPKALAEDGVTDSAIRRLIVDAGEDIDALFMFCRADMTSKNPQKLQLYRKRLKEVEQMVADVTDRDALRNWQPPVTGEDIMKTFGIGPSREVGFIKTEIREQILEGQIANTKEAAVKFMLELGKKYGLTPIK